MLGCLKIEGIYGLYREYRRYSSQFSLRGTKPTIGYASGLGTTAGTVLVKDINPGSTGSYPFFLTDVNGTLFFTAGRGGIGPNRQCHEAQADKAFPEWMSNQQQKQPLPRGRLARSFLVRMRHDWSSLPCPLWFYYLLRRAPARC